MSLLTEYRRRRKHGRTGSRRQDTDRGLTHLGDLRSGERARIVSFHGGRGFREKMSCMGLFPGIEVEVIKRDGEDGMMLVSVGGTRLMLGSGMAGKVHVEVEE